MRNTHLAATCEKFQLTELSSITQRQKENLILQGNIVYLNQEISLSFPVVPNFI